MAQLALDEDGRALAQAEHVAHRGGRQGEEVAHLLAELVLYLAARFFIPGWGLPALGNADSFGADIDRLFYVIEGPVGFFFILSGFILTCACQTIGSSFCE